MMSECCERLRFSVKHFQRRKRSVSQALCGLAGFFQTNDRRVGSLFCGRVLPGGLAQLLAGLCDIEDVVDDLKREADVVAKGRERSELGGRAVRAHAAKSDGTAEQCGCLSFMNVLQFGGSNSFPFAFQIGDLAGDQLARTGYRSN